MSEAYSVERGRVVTPIAGTEDEAFDRAVRPRKLAEYIGQPRVKAQLYFGHAINDQSMPAEAIDKLDRALASWGGKYESEIYDGAYHGWTTADAPVYNQPQAERAFEKLTTLFAKTLK